MPHHSEKNKNKENEEKKAWDARLTPEKKVKILDDEATKEAMESFLTDIDLVPPNIIKSKGRVKLVIFVRTNLTLQYVLQSTAVAIHAGRCKRMLNELCLSLGINHLYTRMFESRFGKQMHKLCSFSTAKTILR